MKNNQKGAIILFVVVIIGIIGILYASVYVLLGTENKIYSSLENRTKAYYIAESGAERGVAMVRQGSIASFTISNPFTPQYKDAHQYDVTISQPQTDTFRIYSVGTYKNTKRIIEIIVLKQNEDYVIQSWKEID